MSPRLAFALDTVVQAGRGTLAHFQTGLGYERKDNDTPVTLADRAAERLIRDAIGRAYPGDAILGEEEGGERQRTQWVIDPIDGTKSFVAGVPLYATLLSYEVDGEPEIGVCYFPALDEMHYAERGQGAYCNGRVSRVSKRSLREGVVCCAGHNGMAKFGRMDGLLKLAKTALATRTWCDAYGHMLVATGRVEAMIDPVVAHWDVSAVSLIVREAGGMATHFGGGNPLDPVHASGELELISTNGSLHQEILEAFRA